MKTKEDLFAADAARDAAVCGRRLSAPASVRPDLAASGAHDPTPTPYFLLDELLAPLGLGPGDHLLDVGCGTGRVLAYAADRLRGAGAREVHWVPIFTKKGRPAWQLQVIASIEDVERLEGIIFAETTTIGIRRWLCDRTVLERAWTTAKTPWGEVRTKVVTLPNGLQRSMPEYEDVAAIARREHLPFQTVMDAARSSASA